MPGLYEFQIVQSNDESVLEPKFIDYQGSEAFR